ncbi:hypothetical protein HK102_009104 [Quaeritorhiza haematococci]|nr:hypothetical protein HK102_009104 [Quaeritorhiza haematococci]
MAIHHATDGQGMELWDEFSRRAGPYDRRVLEIQWDSFKNGSGITVGSLIHWGKEDAKAAQDERKRMKIKEEKMKSDEGLRREAVKFGVNHTGGQGVFESWDDPENLVAVIKNTMHHPGHRVKCVFGPDGAFQQCLECAWRNPFAGQLMIPKTEYPVLHQQFINITINNTVNNVNVNIDSVDIGWNQFREDGVVIVEDEEMNKLLLEALSGTHQRIAKLANHVFGTLFAYGSKTWWHFKKCKDRKGMWTGGALWVSDKEDMAVKKSLVDDDFLTLFVKAKAAFENTAVEVKDRKRKVERIQYVINQLEMQSYKASVVKELAPIVAEQSANDGFFKKLGMNRNLIGFDNGVYDLAGMCFREARPDDFLTKTVGYDFDPVRRPEIEKAVHDFFDQVFPDPEVKTYMLKFLASCLAGHTSDQLCHFGHGDGSNGKGILNNLMALTLGEYAGPMSAQFLTCKIKDADAPTPTLTRLVGCRFVYISEVVDGSSINEQTFKQLTGEDRLTFRPLHGEQVDFHPDFKLFMVCNSLPTFNGGDDAMGRRLRLIPFVSSFKSRNELRRAPGAKHVFLRNDSLNEEIKGWKMSFMHILLEHYQSYKNEKLELTGIIKKLTDEWINSNNAVTNFINEAFEFGAEFTIHQKYLRLAYEEWKRETNGTIGAEYNKRKKFNEKMETILTARQGVEKCEVRMKGKAFGTMGYRGVGLRQEYFDKLVY